MAYRSGNNPANLRQRITFLRSTEGSDDLGWGSPETEAWEDHVTVYAELKTNKGLRYIEAAAVQLQNSKTFTIRYRKDVDDSMRIRYKGEVYYIESLTDDDGLRQWMTIVCKEVV